MEKANNRNGRLYGDVCTRACRMDEVLWNAIWSGKQADSIFNEVETKYNKLKQIAKASNTRHSVIIDDMNGSVWYVPGGQSTIGQIIADANASYPFSDDKTVAV